MHDITPPPQKVYVCDACDAEHEYHHDAEDCCRPEVYTQWKCMGCDDLFGSEDQAQECHERHLDQQLIGGFRQPTPQELEAAGQQRLIP